MPLINPLTEWFHRDEKILMLSSSVVCLSFPILNTFENYNSVSNFYNQMDVIFFEVTITSSQERFAKGASRVLIRSLTDFL